jgi:hypothetical protein
MAPAFGGWGIKGQQAMGFGKNWGFLPAFIDG